MAIQFRRGNEADLVADQLLPAEPAYASDTGRFLIGNGEGGVSAVPTEADVASIVNSFMAQRIPIGTILLWPSSTIPEGTLPLNGQLVNRADYPDLWEFAQNSGAIMSEMAWPGVLEGCFTYGDGSTTFRLPNYRGRVPVGYDASQVEFNYLGRIGGAKTVSLSLSHMPTHSHMIPVRQGASGFGSDSAAATPSATGTVTTLTSSSAGSGESHNNLQPYTVVNYIIVAKNETTHGDIESALADLIAETEAARDNANTAAGEARGVVSGISAVSGVVKSDGEGNFAAATKADIGLGDVDNTADTDKPVSTAQAQAIANALSEAKDYTDTVAEDKADKADTYTKAEVDDALSDKVDKVEGKGLSTEDYTTEEKQRLAGIADGATRYTDDMAQTVAEGVVAAHNTSETAHADIRADLAAEHLNTEKRLAPLEALARTLDMLNPHGEDTVTATTTTAGEATLPKNAANGRLGLVVKGSTLKNELNYNPETWAEWSMMSGGWVVGDSTGLEFTSNGTKTIWAYLLTQLKPSTKYGLLYEVVESTLTSNPEMESHLTGSAQPLPKAVGCQKFTFTTQAVLANNRFAIRVLGTTPAGEKIKVRDIRIYELPTTSSIEADFTNLTGTELDEIYPFGVIHDALPAKITSKGADGNTVSEAFTPSLIMRSVPNGVADEYNVNAGVYTQKVSWTVFNGSADENWILSLNDVNTLRLFSLSLSGTIHIPTSDSTNIICDRFTPKIIFSLDEEGIFIGASNGRVYVRILKSKLATPDVAGFRQWLSNNPMTLFYQLAEPIITQYPQQYPKCKGGGSLTVENILGDADFYGEGVTVEGLTFSEIVKVTKIDLENGLETDVTDTCTLNEDKDGFTSTELAAGDICWYELRIDPATTTLPAVEYSYYDSRFVAVDDTDGKMYRWRIATTNGVARIETEEIV